MLVIALRYVCGSTYSLHPWRSFLLLQPLPLDNKEKDAFSFKLFLMHTGWCSWLVALLVHIKSARRGNRKVFQTRKGFRKELERKWKMGIGVETAGSGTKKKKGEGE